MSAHGHSGMTPAEAQVMDLWDAGVSMQKIARQLGRPKRFVDRVVSMYHAGPEPSGNARIRAGSQALLAALQRAA